MATCTRSSSLSRALLLPYLHSRTQTLCEPIRIARFSSTMKQPRPPSLFVRSQAKRGPFLKQDQVAATSKQKNKKKLITIFVMHALIPLN